ncbi:unnamed protein product, partial [Chrysoparadoxa australica]
MVCWVRSCSGGVGRTAWWGKCCQGPGRYVPCAATLGVGTTELHLCYVMLCYAMLCLEEQGNYMKYVAVVEGLLMGYLRMVEGDPSEEGAVKRRLIQRLWQQLVVTANAFGMRLTEQGKNAAALEMLQQAESLSRRDEQLMTKQSALELKGFILDSYAFYYLRRGKATAALDYMGRALKIHVRAQNWTHVAKFRLHLAAVLARLNRHSDSLACLGKFLAMVEDGRLDIGGSSPQKLCMVAVCYHNAAVEHLATRSLGEACSSSQNARRLARLCLSFSNRWVHCFEGT